MIVGNYGSDEKSAMIMKIMIFFFPLFSTETVPVREQEKNVL